MYSDHAKAASMLVIAVLQQTTSRHQDEQPHLLPNSWCVDKVKSDCYAAKGFLTSDLYWATFFVEIHCMAWLVSVLKKTKQTNPTPQNNTYQIFLGGDLHHLVWIHLKLSLTSSWSRNQETTLFFFSVQGTNFIYYFAPKYFPPSLLRQKRKKKSSELYSEGTGGLTPELQQRKYLKVFMPWLSFSEDRVFLFVFPSQYQYWPSLKPCFFLWLDSRDIPGVIPYSNLI